LITKITPNHQAHKIDEPQTLLDKNETRLKLFDCGQQY
jgi:hypothetical protein